jgi:hypothetical protein
MNNTQHIQENYKSSTIVRLMEQFKYNTEEEINDDKDITDTLIFLEGHNLQVQDVFFQCLEVVKNVRK